jgi:hypothetical protein
MNLDRLLHLVTAHDAHSREQVRRMPGARHGGRTARNDRRANFALCTQDINVADLTQRLARLEAKAAKDAALLKVNRPGGRALRAAGAPGCQGGC